MRQMKQRKQILRNQLRDRMRGRMRGRMGRKDMNGGLGSLGSLDSLV